MIRILIIYQCVVLISPFLGFSKPPVISHRRGTTTIRMAINQNVMFEMMIVSGTLNRNTTFLKLYNERSRNKAVGKTHTEKATVVVAKALLYFVE